LSEASATNWPVRVETARLVVRPLADHDIDDLVDVIGDDEVTAYLPYVTWRTREDGDAWLARIRALEADDRARQYVFVDRESQRAIGVLVLFQHDPVSRRAEIGYAIGRAHWRRGLMREALPVFIERAFADLELMRIQAFADARNEASHRLLLGLGFSHEGTLRRNVFFKGEWADSRVYGLLRDEGRTTGVG